MFTAMPTFKMIETQSKIKIRTTVMEPVGAIGERRLCLLLHGRTEFIEKYEEVMGELLQRGYVIVTFDWRGQGASQRPLADQQKGHVGEFSEYDEDFDAVLDQMFDHSIVLGQLF